MAPTDLLPLPAWLTPTAGGHGHCRVWEARPNGASAAPAIRAPCLPTSALVEGKAWGCCLTTRDVEPPPSRPAPWPHLTEGPIGNVREFIFIF